VGDPRLHLREPGQVDLAGQIAQRLGVLDAVAVERDQEALVDGRRVDGGREAASGQDDAVAASYQA
jgi:hypothetical protein